MCRCVLSAALLRDISLALKGHGRRQGETSKSLERSWRRRSEFRDARPNTKKPFMSYTARKNSSPCPGQQQPTNLGSAGGNRLVAVATLCVVAPHTERTI